MRLVIAEKNEAARDIAGALLGRDPKSVRLPASGDGWVVCAASGHLMELCEPAAIDEGLSKWEVAPLPLSFNPWPKQPSGDYGKKKLDIILRYIGDADEIYCCGDADDEGQLIVDEILEHAGIDPTDARCMRVYVNDNLPKNILRALEAAKPNAECVGDGHAAHARQLADMCFGVNESRLATCKLGAKFTIGRVQTPTLGLVVERDLAREGHVKRMFHTLTVTVETPGGDLEFNYRPPEAALEDGKHCFDRELMEKAANAARGALVSFDVALARKSLQPPLPFEMTSLVSDMSKRHSMTSDDVMKATQSLRDDHKAITYNRTDSPYLKDEHFKQAPAVTAVAMENLGVSLPIDTSIKGRAFNEEKAAASPHHGIIPQEIRLDVPGLGDKERLVYVAVAMRYLAQFMPAAEYVESSASFAVPGVEGAFEHNAKWKVSGGWTEHVPSLWVGAKLLGGSAPAAGPCAGSVVGCDVAEKETKPPAAFTDGTLTVAMANIARYVQDPEVKRILLEKDADSPNEHGSIGTTATRKDIIEGLIEHGYLQRSSGKRREITSTPKARAFWKIIPDEIKGVDLTARWWLMQRRVAAGELDDYAIMRSVCEQFAAHKESAYAGMSLKPNVGTCPRCGKKVLIRGTVYSCESNKSEKQPDGTWKDIAGCGFKIFGFCGKKLTPNQAAALLAGKAVKLKGCSGKKKDGTPTKFDCSVTLDRATGKLVPDFGPKPKRGQRR